VIARPNILLCDEERASTDALATELRALGHTVTITRSCTDAFSAACANDYAALVVAPYLRDGAALVLPRALGIRRPPLVVLVSRLSDRIAAPVARHLGFDVQLTKIVDAKRLDRLIRSSMAAVAREQRLQRAAVQPPVQVQVQVQDDVETPPPASDVGARAPRS